MNPVLTIDPEFEAKCPPLTEDELSQLEENILDLQESAWAAQPYAAAEEIPDWTAIQGRETNTRRR